MIEAAEVDRLVSWVKWRLYRFSDSLAAHVCAEEVEELVRTGRPVPEVVVREVARFIKRHGSDGDVSFDVDPVAAALGIDPPAEIGRRLSVTGGAGDDGPVVLLTGPPRSGSTDVLNRLVHATGWATFTDHSHHLWSPYNLERAAPRYLTSMSPAHLEDDTTTGRLDPLVSWPSEGEQILHRAVPVVSLVRGHVYELDEARASDVAMLDRVIAQHRRHADSDVFVSKSPFHVLRLDVLDRLWRSPVVVLVDRAEGRSAASMERQGFKYRIDGAALPALEAERMFRRKAIGRADLVIDHDEFRRDPAVSIARLRQEIERRC